MRILKKAAILPVTCDHCGCVYKPGIKDLVTGLGSIVLRYAPCPTCRKYNEVRFKKENNNAQS